MSKSKNNKVRSGEAQAANHRNGGPMRHRLQPRGGARNEQADIELDYDLAWYEQFED